MSIVTDPIKLAPTPPIFGNSIEDTITADNADSFEDILQKQFSIRNENALQSPIGLYGIPTGMEIQPLIQEYVGVQDVVNKISPLDNADTQDYVKQQNDKETNVAETLPDLNINQETDRHSSLFKFAKKHAANFYGKCSGNVVLNLDEFVNDTINLN